MLEEGERCHSWDVQSNDLGVVSHAHGLGSIRVQVAGSNRQLECCWHAASRPRSSS